MLCKSTAGKLFCTLHKSSAPVYSIFYIPIWCILCRLRCYGRGCFAHRAKLPQETPVGVSCSAAKPSTNLRRGLAAKRDCASRARMRAATAFFRREKGSKTRCSPAPSEKRRQRFSTAPNRLGGNLFLLMWLECARPLFTLTPAACAFPAQAGPSPLDRTRTECSIKIARR